MKKLIIILMIFVMINSAFATVPIAYTAELKAPRSMIVSGGTDNTFASLHAGFTYGLEKTNLHIKTNLEFGFFYLEGLLQYYLGAFKDINLGFTWGARTRIMRGNVEFAPIAIWNMSYQFMEDVVFYGGAKFNLDLGNTTWAGFYVDFDLNGFIGTEITLSEKIKLYLEVEPALWSGVNNAYIGVNYYLPNKSLVTE